LIDEPRRLEVNLAGLPDGFFALVLEVLDGDSHVCTLAKSVYAVRGLAAAQAEVEQILRAVEGHESLKATIRYPFDFARRLDAGLREQRHEDFAALVARSRELARGLAQGQDPLEGARGDLKRHYLMKEAGAILPYRLFVPSAYEGRPTPLVVALHGAGGSENTMVDRDNGVLKTLAERYGFLVASPLGYRPNSNYGLGQSAAEAAVPALMRTAVMAGKDVMHVLEAVRREYNVDSRRIYLLGHSGGGGGTWVLGVSHPEIWAALAPIASAFNASGWLDLTRIKHIPVLIAHGDRDNVAPIESSRGMASKLTQAGGSPRLVVIPGAGHDTAVAAALPEIFAFFQQTTR
jgi:poly(3-hydroxybutyrate) depolymerase